MKVKIAKWGNSLAIRLPKAAVESAGLHPGTELDVVVEGRDLRLRQSANVPCYRLDDLIAEMDRIGPKNRPELVEWGPDLGTEIIDDDYSRGLLGAPSGGHRVGEPETNTRPRTGRRPPRRRA
jgi:antitoxin MazE